MTSHLLVVFLLFLSSAVSSTRASYDNTSYPDEDDDRYDFIIVGGGAAGCVLARRLTEVPQWRVLLLEAGGEEPEWSRIPAYSSLTLDPRGNIDWGYTTVPSPESCAGVGCQFPRGKVLGGSTSTNGMFYVRGSKQDYDDWEQMGNEGWGYDDLLKYFIKSERNRDELLAATKYHGSDGLLDVEVFKYQDVNAVTIMDGLVQFGLPVTDLNGKHILGAALTQMTTHNGERRSVNHAFLRSVRDRPNLVVLTNAQVSLVLIQNASDAYGIEYLQNNQTHQAFAAKEVILSAGSIGTPQILQLSGIGPTEVLEPLGIEVIANLPVGENLQDHVCSTTVAARVSNTSQLPNAVTDQFNDFVNYTHRREGPLTSTGTLQIAAFFPPVNTTIHDDEVPYMEMTFAPATSEGILPFCYYDKVYFVGILQKPVSKGWVRINSTDVRTPIMIQPNYFNESLDMDRMVEAAFFAMDIIETPALKEKGFEIVKDMIPGCENYTWGTYDYWSCGIRMTTRSNFHPVTTCKMGPISDPTTVVDSRLRVHGISSLRVMDASIMPTMISGHTMAPAIAIGEKGADMLKEDWGITE